MSDQKVDLITASSAVSETPGKKDFHYARRGIIASEAVANSEIEGYDAERMKARTLLTVDEEKKLLRKIDLRLMTLCSIMFLLKNIDADNVSNARIMNKGQPSNIMKELNMTSNQYNLVTTMYYVSKPSKLTFVYSDRSSLRYPTFWPRHRPISSSNGSCRHDGSRGSW
jgi:hypothetical protein